MQRLDFRAMGCQMAALLDDDSPRASRELGRVPEWFEEWEQCLSRFREDSELSEFNRHSGMPQPVSPVMAAVVTAALQAARASDGLVTPALLDALEAAGYDRSFDQLPAAGARRAPAPQHAADWRALEWSPARRMLYAPAGMRLDFGGIAKGWAADRALRRLERTAPALVDAGGDVAAGRAPRGAQGWPIGVANPLRPEQPMVTLRVRAAGIATSGRDYRRWQQDGAWQHHILDARTRRPAETDVLSATVIAPSTRLAETAAKSVLILGSHEGLAWLEARPHLAGMLVCAGGRLLYGRGFEQYLDGVKHHDDEE